MRDLWLMAVAAASTAACRIQGSDTGQCQTPDEFLQYMPFCGPLLQYTACVPMAQTLWYNHSVKSKDLFLSQMYQKLVMQRELFEQDLSLSDAKC
uniref:Secreted protein n=1 Tax=Achlya hypogyna TaxID=1202772 RepID=A0A0A7CP15_ACHHY|nr:secreted protein [Achlya hypogyna]